MSCNCIKRITDFPNEWKMTLLTIKTKEEMREKLQGSTSGLFDWSQEITRLTLEIGYLLTGLPQDIKSQYLLVRLKDTYKKKWQEAVTNNNKLEADVWFKKYKSVFKCQGEDSCECRNNNNG